MQRLRALGLTAFKNALSRHTNSPPFGRLSKRAAIGTPLSEYPCFPSAFAQAQLQRVAYPRLILGFPEFQRIPNTPLGRRVPPYSPRMSAVLSLGGRAEQLAPALRKTMFSAVPHLASGQPDWAQKSLRSQVHWATIWNL
ncbi:MAG: hypothetical protein D6691_01245 [Candidatus Hydrogenedentota bacterium]|jgi:hypothetical protein|nr:MAG: hypothetical protein D6691_01245 [Candidatus Hydrogenedentota bacterium]